jgi:hypothetical protein
VPTSHAFYRAPRFLTVFAATQRHRLRSAVW